MEQASESIRVGDIVRAKTGGPPMTVVNLDMSGPVIGLLMYTCRWTEDGVEREQVFSRFELERADGPPSGGAAA